MADTVLNAGITAGGALYREFRFLPSHSVSVELQCGISRLEVPIAVLETISAISEESFACAHVMSSQVNIASGLISTYIGTTYIGHRL